MSTEQRPGEQQPQGTGEQQSRSAGNQQARASGEPQAGEPQGQSGQQQGAASYQYGQQQPYGKQPYGQQQQSAQPQGSAQSRYGWQTQNQNGWQQQQYPQNGWQEQQSQSQPVWQDQQQNGWQVQQGSQQYDWQQGSRQGQQADEQQQNGWQAQQDSSWQQAQNAGQVQSPWQSQQQAQSSWQQPQSSWQSQQQQGAYQQPQPGAQPQSGWQQPQQQAVWQNQQQNGWQAQSPQAQPQQQSQWRQQQGPQSSGLQQQQGGWQPQTQTGWQQSQSQNAWQQQQQGAYQQPQPGAQPQSGWQPQQSGWQQQGGWQSQPQSGWQQQGGWQPQPQSGTQPQPGAYQPQPQQPAKPVQHHVHHSYIWLNSLQVLVVLLLIGLVAVLPMMAGGLVMGLESGEVVAYALFVGSVILMGVSALAVVVLCYWWSWRHLYYELGDEEFSLYSGIFNKKRVHVPYQRIQSVDQHATLFQRLFGVCTVTIDTAGGAANKAVVVPYLRKSDAEELRRELFARKGYAVARQNAARQPAAGVSGAAGASSAAAPGTDSLGQTGNILDVPAGVWDSVRGVFGGDQVQMGRVTFEYGLSNKELIFTGLTNNTAFIAVVLTLIGIIAQVASTFITPYPGYTESLLELAADLGVSLLGDNLVVVLVVAFAVVAVVVWLFSAVGVCINYGGFRARRCDNRIEVERGLLQHRVQGVDVSRVQYVKVRQSVICRLLGYCELSLGKVDAIDTEEESPDPSDEHTIVIHPFVKLSRVPEIIDGLIPEYSDMPVETTRVAPVALRRSIIRDSVLQGTGFWIAVILFVIQLISHLSLGASTVEEEIALLSYIDAGVYVGYIVCAILFAVDVVGAVLWYLDASFACNRRFMQVTNGGFTRETVTFPRVKIQYASTRSNPLQRHAHTATIIARTAAGVGGTTVSLMDVREQDADNWLDWAKPYGNMLH